MSCFLSTNLYLETLPTILRPRYATRQLFRIAIIWWLFRDYNLYPYHCSPAWLTPITRSIDYLWVFLRAEISARAIWFCRVGFYLQRIQILINWNGFDLLIHACKFWNNACGHPLRYKARLAILYFIAYFEFLYSSLFRI